MRLLPIVFRPYSLRSEFRISGLNASVIIEAVPSERVGALRELSRNNLEYYYLPSGSIRQFSRGKIREKVLEDWQIADEFDI